MFKIAAFLSSIFLTSSAVAAEPPSAPTPATHQLSSVYHMNPDNTIAIDTEISSSSYKKFASELHRIRQKHVLLYIDSLGGSVIDGSKMIHVALSHKKAYGTEFTCLIQDAASMAFAIVQTVCDTRVVSPTSILMQHQMAFGTFGQIERIDSTVRMVRDLERYLNKAQAKRLGMTVKAFRKVITNDWYLVGRKAVKYKAADQVGHWLCSPAYQACPLLK